MPPHTVLDPKRTNSVPVKHCALGIMTKVPEAGKVKTRLSPPLSPEEAAQINTCFLRDLAGSIKSATQVSPAVGVGVFTPAGAEAAYEEILPSDFYLIAQRGRDFGERLLFAAQDLIEVGFAAMCLINSDSPTVPAAVFAEAANELGRPGDRVVLGPSDDGGYYLIGLKTPHARLFQEIDWSTERVFNQTMARAEEIGLKIHLLPSGYDVDDRLTLSRLCQEVLGSDTKTTNVSAPHTRKFLADIVEREGRDRIWPK